MMALAALALVVCVVGGALERWAPHTLARWADRVFR